MADEICGLVYLSEILCVCLYSEKNVTSASIVK